jgi:hypothetical protein
MKCSHFITTKNIEMDSEAAVSKCDTGKSGIDTMLIIGMFDPGSAAYGLA